MEPDRDGEAESASHRLACRAARLLAEDKCEDLLVLDLRGLSPIAHYFVIGTGTSDRQIRSVAENLRELSREAGEPILSSQGARSASWLVVDFVDVVVHLFESGTRAYYDLESLWGDAPAVDWRAALEAAPGS